MSSTLSEQVPIGISPPTRPSIWRLGWATFVGYLVRYTVFGTRQEQRIPLRHPPAVRCP
jgi:hypothetical protein